MLSACQGLLVSFCITVVTFSSFNMLCRFEKPLVNVNNVEVVSLDSLRRFDDYVKKYNRSYSRQDYLSRLRYFEDSLKEISRLNALHGSEVFGITKFADWSAEEKNSIICSSGGATCLNSSMDRCGEQRRVKGWEGMGKSDGKYVGDDIPLKVDWRNQSVIGKVLDQKMCRGCWAFTIVGTMESMWAIAGNGFHSLSIQELLDCSTYNSKCNGGDIESALSEMCADDYPIVSEKDYPLKLVSEACRMPRTGLPPGRKIAEYNTKCFLKDENFILNRIAKFGPVVARINSSPWFYYRRGVIQKACLSNLEYMFHAIQIVGYDLTASVPYYIVRNNWGEDFGEDGYLRIAIYSNVCGIANSIAYFTVK